MQRSPPTTNLQQFQALSHGSYLLIASYNCSSGDDHSFSISYINPLLAL